MINSSEKLNNDILNKKLKLIESEVAKCKEKKCIYEIFNNKIINVIIAKFINLKSEITSVGIFNIANIALCNCADLIFRYLLKLIFNKLIADFLCFR